MGRVSGPFLHFSDGELEQMKKIFLLGVIGIAVALTGCAGTHTTFDVQPAAAAHPIRGVRSGVIVQTTAVQQDFDNGATGHFMNVVVTDPRSGKVLSGGTYAFNDDGVPRMLVKTIVPAVIGGSAGIVAAGRIRPSNFIIQGGQGGNSISGAVAGAVSNAGAAINK